MSLVLLTDNDFRYIPDSKILTLDRPGPWVVFFYSQTNQACIGMRNTISIGCRNNPSIKFGMVDIAASANASRSSFNSSTPINRVPMLIGYYNGRPRTRITKDDITQKELQDLINTTIQVGAESQQPSMAPSTAPSMNYQQMRPSAMSNFQETFSPVPSMTAATRRPSSMGTTDGLYAPGHDTRLNIPRDITPYTDPWSRK